MPDIFVMPFLQRSYTYNVFFLDKVEQQNTVNIPPAKPKRQPSPVVSTAAIPLPMPIPIAHAQAAAAMEYQQQNLHHAPAGNNNSRAPSTRVINKKQSSPDCSASSGKRRAEKNGVLASARSSPQKFVLDKNQKKKSKRQNSAETLQENSEVFNNTGEAARTSNTTSGNSSTMALAHGKKHNSSSRTNQFCEYIFLLMNVSQLFYLWVAGFCFCVGGYYKHNENTGISGLQPGVFHPFACDYDYPYLQHLMYASNAGGEDGPFGQLQLEGSSGGLVYGAKDGTTQQNLQRSLGGAAVAARTSQGGALLEASSGQTPASQKATGLVVPNYYQILAQQNQAISMLCRELANKRRNTMVSNLSNYRGGSTGSSNTLNTLVDGGRSRANTNFLRGSHESVFSQITDSGAGAAPLGAPPGVLAGGAPGGPINQQQQQPSSQLGVQRQLSAGERSATLGHTPTRRGTRTLTGVSCVSAVSEGGISCAKVSYSYCNHALQIFF